MKTDIRQVQGPRGCFPQAVTYAAIVLMLIMLGLLMFVELPTVVRHIFGLVVGLIVAGGIIYVQVTELPYKNQ